MPRKFSFAAADPASPAEPSTSQDPLLTRIVLAPLLFVSFLLSLFLVDRDTSGSVLGLSSTSPPSARDGPSPPKGGKKDERYYHSHQRKLMRREIGDAFEMRKRVMVGLCVGLGVAVAGVAWLTLKMWEAWNAGRLTRWVKWDR